jgi:type III secretory pathway component EscR
MPINLSATVTNVSGKGISWRAERSNTAYRTFNFFLKKDGQEVETTFFYRNITGRQRPNDPSEIEWGSSIVSLVAPGKSFTFAIDLTWLYEITESGVYTLDLGRYDENTKTSVFSNTLTLTIVP